ncbi:hypothetical protein AYO44_05565 [Planctomycetaceae bacterium SCGC AG-212-F19]|nr:hypothetical protein AYO44_05565 [Planctomycetaceae bacterium SCGC AG-212-F19]
MTLTAPASVGWFRERYAGSRRPWTRRGRLAILGVLACLAATVWFCRDLRLLPALGVWSLWLVGLGAFLRHRRVKFFGPVCFHDLIRTGRQARYNALRCTYVLALLVTLSVVYAGWFAERGGTMLELFAGGALDGRDMASFAESFFLNCVWVQFAVAILLTPVYVGSALTEEKERQTLDGVLASDLEDQEIVLGKLASRLAHLLLVLGAGLPVLAVTQLLGGVAPELVLASYLFTAVSVVSLGSLSMLCSVYARRTANAVFGTYFWLIVFLCGTLTARWITFLINELLIDKVLPRVFDIVFDASMPAWITTLPYPNFGNPLLALYDFNQGLFLGQPVFVILRDVLVGYVVFQMLFTLACCYRATRLLRRIALQPEAPLPLWRRPGVEFPPRLHRPRLGNRSPLLWKEMHADAPIGTHRFSALLMYLQIVLGWFLVVVFLCGIMSFGFGVWDLEDLHWPSLMTHLNGLVRGLGVFLATLMLLAVAGYAPGSMSRERERHTLDALLTLPIDRADIVFAKWLGAPLAVRPLWWCLGIIWGLGVLTGGLHLLALPLLVLAWWIYACFLSALGLWFSIGMRSTMRATVWTLFTIVGLVLACRLVGNNARLFFASWMPEGWAIEVGRWFNIGVMPPAALSVLSFKYGEPLRTATGPGASAANLRAVLIGLLCWAIGAGVLWRWNRRRFLHLTEQAPVRGG